MKLPAALAVGAMVWAITVPVAAEESVKVRRFPSYPPPNRSSEFVDVAVSRVPGALAGPELDVDRYFAALRAVLADEGVPESWGSVLPDASYVRIEIVLGEKRYVLANTFGPDGPLLPANATAADRRIAAAFRRVLALTVERARSTLGVAP